MKNEKIVNQSVVFDPASFLKCTYSYLQTAGMSLSQKQ